MEIGEWREVDGRGRRDGVGLVWVGSQTEGEGLYLLFSLFAFEERKGKGENRRTPFTILVPTRVTCPLTISFRGVLTTSVLPGSTGASSA